MSGHVTAGSSTAPRPEPTSAAARRVGYVAAAVVNCVLLWVVNHLLGWGWPPFLTDDFDDLLPVVSLSLTATVVVNVLWAWRDPPWFRHLAQVVLDAISLVVVVRTWQVFPFDFTAYWSGWETVARVVLALAFVGVIVDAIVRLVALARAADR